MPGEPSAATRPGALFGRIWHAKVSHEPMTGHALSRMLRARAVAAGLDGTRITAHSLRARPRHHRRPGRGVLDRIAAQTRHKDIGVLVDRYIRPLEALGNTSSKDLGL